MSQSTVTEKRTVISSSSTSGGGGYESLEDIPYKANLGSRSSNIMTRSSLPMRSSSGGGTSIVRTVEYGYGSSMGGMGPGGYSNVSNTGVSNVKNTREREKKDLQDLNERFANYIEKVRFLEAQNRKLGSELDELRSKWGKETSHIKQMYEAELAEARRLIDDLSKDKAALEIKMSSIQEQNAEINRQLDEAKKYRQQDREIMNKQNQQLADLESELNMLRRTIESLETERGRDKATINRLQQEVDKLRIDLNNETLAHLDAENRRQTLEEEMEFMKKVHEQELKELAALAYRDTTAENREYWKNELGQAIRDIQSEYDAKVEQLRGDMEGFYNLKIQEFRTGATKQNMEVTHVREENKKIVKQMSDLRGKYADLEARNAQLEKQYRDVMRELDSKDEAHMMEVTQFKEEISKLRVEMEGILQELQTLMDAKLSLELEICAYRKLLEGEENRVDWRSRASLIMYRDAFKPSSSNERNEPEKPVEKPVVKVVEKIVEAKQEPVLKFEPRDASPDTDAACSVTISDKDPTSPDSEIPPRAMDIDTDMSKTDDSKETGDEDDKNVGDDAPPSPVEHPVIVKKVVEEIESRAKDYTDGSSTPSPVKTQTFPLETNDDEVTLDEETIKDDKVEIESKDDQTVINEPTVEIKDNAPLESSIKTERNVETESTATTVDIKDQTEQDVAETPDELKSDDKSTADIEVDQKGLGKGSVEDRTDETHAETVSKDVNPNMNQSSTILSSPGVTSPVDVLGTDLSDTVTDKSVESEPESHVKTNVLEEKRTKEIVISDDKSENIDQPKIEAQHTDLASESIPKPNEIDAGASHEVVDKTEDKPLETVVLCEQVEKENIEEPTVLETSPTKESLEKQITGTNVDTQPDTLEIKSSFEPELNDEVVDKTEDKVDETVVLSEQEKEQIIQEPAVVETSPAKESPVKPNPGTNVDAKPDSLEIKSSIEPDFIDEDVDTTGDKVEETVVLSEQEEKQIIQKPAVVETSPAKESPVKPIPGTIVDAKPDSLEIKSSIEPDAIDKVVDKTEDKLEETAVSSEQEKKEIIQESAGVETTATKESPEKPIPGTNVDVKPDSLEIKSSIEPELIDEVVDKTKDKLEETVVLHEQEEKQIIQEPAVVETSPTKESPVEPVDGNNVDTESDTMEITSSIEPELKHEVIKKGSLMDSANGQPDTVTQQEAPSELQPNDAQPDQLPAESNENLEKDVLIKETNVMQTSEYAGTDDQTIEKQEINVALETEQHIELASESTSNLDETDTDAGHEVVDKTEDKVVETVVLSEQVEKQILTEPAVVETSPTKESPDEPIPSTNVDAEPDSLEIESSIEPEINDQVVDNATVEDSANGQQNTVTQKETPSDFQTKDTQSVELPVESNENVEKDVLNKETNVMQTSVYAEGDNQIIEKQEISVTLETATTLKDDICEPGDIANEPPKTEESVNVKDTDKTADNNPETMQEANAQSAAVVDQKTESTNGTVEGHIKTESEDYQEPNDTKEEPIENKDVESNESEQSEIAFTKDKHESNIEIVQKAEEVSESSRDSSAHDLVAEKESITNEIVSADIASDKPLESLNLEQAQTDDIKEETLISTSTPPTTPITESAKTKEQEAETSETKDLTNESLEDQSKTQHAKVVSFKSDVLKEQPVHEAELKSSPKESTESADNEIKVGQTNEQAMSVEKTTEIETKSDTVEIDVHTTESHEVHTTSKADIMQQSMHEDLQETVNVTNGDNTHDDNESNVEETDDASDNKKTADEPKAKKDVTVNGAKDDIPETDDNQTKLDEEERIKALIKGNDTQMSMKMMRGEVSAKTTYQRTSTGPIAISEVSPEGKFIMLENTSSGPNRKDVNLDGWKLRRTVDGKRDYSYNFRNFTLKAGKKVKILARGSAAEAGLNDLVFREEDNWGVGSQVTTTLINDKNEDKASHVQKTLYN